MIPNRDNLDDVRGCLGLMIAVPAGLFLWALIIWAIVAVFA